MGSPWAWPWQLGVRAGLHPSSDLQSRVHLHARSLTPTADVTAQKQLPCGPAREGCGPLSALGESGAGTVSPVLLGVRVPSAREPPAGLTADSTL